MSDNNSERNYEIKTNFLLGSFFILVGVLPTIYALNSIYEYIKTGEIQCSYRGLNKVPGIEGVLVCVAILFIGIALLWFGYDILSKYMKTIK